MSRRRRRRRRCNSLVNGLVTLTREQNFEAKTWRPGKSSRNYIIPDLVSSPPTGLEPRNCASDSLETRLLFAITTYLWMALVFLTALRYLDHWEAAERIRQPNTQLSAVTSCRLLVRSFRAYKTI